MKATLAPAALFARADLRRRWQGVVIAGLLFGIAAGIGLASLAGARRTASVFDRHLASSNASDIEIDPGAVTPEADAALRSLPNVTAASYWLVYNAFPLTADGRVDERLAGTISFTTDGRYLDMDRLATTSGRVLDPDNPHEVMVNQSFVDATGIGVGSSFEIGIIETDDDDNPTTLEPAPADRLDVTVVGVMVLNEEISSEDIDTLPRLFVSPAARRMPVGDSRYYGYSWYGLTVEGGPAAVNEVQVAWQRMADAHNATARVAGGGQDGWLSYVHRASDLQRKADRAVRPLTITLGAFGVLAFLGALTLASQALVRRVRSQRNAVTIARVLGLTPHEGALAMLVAPGLSLAVAALAAAATAVLLSLAFPVGPFDVLEPSTGLDVDRLVLGLGLLLLVLVPLAVITVAAWRESRLATVLDDGGSRTAGRLTSVIGRTGRFPALAAASRLTFDPGRGRRFVPTRSVLVSFTIVVAALVTVVVFGSNLQAFDDSPQRFGWPADAIVASDGGYGPFDKERLAERLDASPEVADWRFVGAGQVTIAGGRAPAALFGPGDPALIPTLTAGGSPDQAGEVVLGSGTMADLDLSIGDRVEVGSGENATSMTVTGTAVFPVLGPVLSTRTGLDRGVWLNEADYRQIDAISAFITYGLADEPQFSFAFVDLVPGGSLARLNDELQSGEGITTGSSVDVTGVIRPSEVRTAAAGGGRTQTILVVVLGLVAGLSTLLALAAVVRRRRSESAIHRVLGFTPGQVRATFLWQGVLVAAVALVIGLPVGIALGRTLWRLFADRLGVVPEPSLPLGALAIASGVALLVGLLGALGPAIRAARLSPAVGLRAE